MKKKIFKILLYLAFLVIFLELFSRVFLSTRFAMKIVSEINCDTSWRIHWVKRQKNNSPNIYDKFDIYDPTKGWAIKPNLRDMPVFNGKFLSSNSKGIRGKSEYEYAKSAKKRILILGDSFTFGDEVSDNETYSYYLQKALASSEVINFGIHGYGHDQMLIYFREEGIKYKPAIVILGFVGADIDRNVLEFRDYSKPKFVVLNGKLRLANTSMVEPEEFIKKEFYRSKLIDLLDLAYHACSQKLNPSYRQQEEVTTLILDEIVAAVRQIKAIPVFIYLPVGNEMSTFNMKLSQEEYLSKYCMDRDVYYMSLRPNFITKANSGSVLKTNGHWGAKEHQTAADAIKGYLENKGIFAKAD